MKCKERSLISFHIQHTKKFHLHIPLTCAQTFIRQVYDTHLGIQKYFYSHIVIGLMTNPRDEILLEYRLCISGIQLFSSRCCTFLEYRNAILKQIPRLHSNEIDNIKFSKCEKTIFSVFWQKYKAIGVVLHYRYDIFFFLRIHV